MNLVSHREYAAQLTVVGTLRLIRMQPVLELSGIPVLQQIKAVVAARGDDPEAPVAADANTIWKAVERDDPEVVPSAVGIFFKSCSVALAVAGWGT